MTESDFLRRLLRYLSEELFYDLQLLGWRVCVIAGLAMILLFLIAWRLLQRAAGAEPVTGIREHPHIIGARLVKSKQHQKGIKEAEENLRADIREDLREDPDPHEKTERIRELNGEIDLLRLRIAKQDQTEARLDQKVAELTRHNEQLQDEVANHTCTSIELDPKVAELTACNERLLGEMAETKQIETQLRQEIADMMACNERLQQEADNSRDAAQCLEQQLAESQAANEQLQSKAAENKYVEEALRLTTRLEMPEAPRQVDGAVSESREQFRRSNQSEEPLDTNTLRSIAELIRRIQGRPAQN